MRVDEVPASLSEADRLVFMVGVVSRRRALLRYALAQTVASLDLIRSGDPGDMTWGELFELCALRVSELDDAVLKAGGLDSLAAAQVERDRADTVVDGFWVPDASDPSVWKFAAPGLGLATRLGQPDSSAAEFVAIANGLEVVAQRLSSLQLLVTKEPGVGAPFLQGEERARHLRVLQGDFTVNDDGTINLG